MGKITGFLDYERQGIPSREVAERKQDFKEIYKSRDKQDVEIQAGRCMDCGIPFCQGPTGCPLGNLIPDWNDLVWKGQWQEALERMYATNNFPEVTGRICPAPCEQACTLNINMPAVTIKQIEKSIGDFANSHEGFKPYLARRKTGKRVAVIGSGPAGLAGAQQLARAGHDVVVFERQDKIGGLLRYGIPDFKMEKGIIDRRMAQMEAEGVEFRVNQHVGINIEAKQIMNEFDAVLLACGSEKPRDLPVPGREAKGIHFAMDFLRQQNRRVSGEEVVSAAEISAKGKKVVVIGGGDTGSDCVGTSLRQDATEVYNLELMPTPPEERGHQAPWPWWPYKLITSHAHEEGGQREWSVMTKRFISDDSGQVKALEAVRLEFVDNPETGRREMKEIPGSEFQIECDLVLLAMGFVHPVREGLIESLGLVLDGRGNVATDNQWHTSLNKVFCAGDMARGQSLVVWAISDGRRAAYEMDQFLMGSTELPRGPRRDLPDLLKGQDKVSL